MGDASYEEAVDPDGHADPDDQRGLLQLRLVP
jgi:hypothetical protein